MVLTTHYMEEAAQLCDRLVIMNEAKILAHGSPQELIKNTQGARCMKSAPRRRF